MTAPKPRPGVALVAALVLLILLGIFAAATVATSVASQRGVRLGQGGATALAAAEFALFSVLESAATHHLSTLALGQPTHFGVVVQQTSPVAADVAVTRLPNGVLWIVADVTVGGSDSAERRVNLVAEFPRAGPVPPAAIQSRGDVRLASDVNIGADTLGDADCAVHTVAPRIVVGPGVAAATAPGVAVETSSGAADSNSYFLKTWQRSILVGGGGVRHVSGDTTIDGGVFDGILLVDGAVTVTGAWVVQGMVVATGPIRALAGGLSVTGALLSAYPGPGRAIDVANATLKFAPCVVADALRRVSSPRPVRERAWAELY